MTPWTGWPRTAGRTAASSTATDLNSNRTEHREWNSQTSSWERTYYGYHALNRWVISLSSTHTDTRTFTQDGKIRVYENGRFDYSADGRTVRFCVPSCAAANPSVWVWYQYDAFGERVQKSDANSETLFVYDGPNLLHEQSNSSSSDFVYIASRRSLCTAIVPKGLS